MAKDCGCREAGRKRREQIERDAARNAAAHAARKAEQAARLERQRAANPTNPLNTK